MPAALAKDEGREKKAVAASFAAAAGISIVMSRGERVSGRVVGVQQALLWAAGCFGVFLMARLAVVARAVVMSTAPGVSGIETPELGPGLEFGSGSGSVPGLGAGSGPGSLWLLFALCADDVLAALGVAGLLTAVALIGSRAGSAKRTARAGKALYFIVALWTIINVPIAFVLGSPLTMAMWDGAGGALIDSIRTYLAPSILGPPAVVALLAVVLVRILPAVPCVASPRAKEAPRAAGSSDFLVRVRTLLRRPGWLPVSALAAVATIVLLTQGGRGIVGTRPQVDTGGLQRNAVITFVASASRRLRARVTTEEEHLIARFERSCAPLAAAPSPVVPLAGAARGRNVVWVILESTGARHLTASKEQATVTPNLSALAATAAVVDRAYAVYPESIKGLDAVLCARPWRGEGIVRAPCESIASTLGGAAHRTGLFHSGRFDYLGMADVVRGRGFDALEDASTIASRHASSFGVDERSTVAALLRFVDAEPQRPFFAVYMPIAGHHPYQAPGDAPRPFRERSAADEHRNDMHVADEAFGRLRQGLIDRGLDENTLYVIFGDHGEAFGEHPGNIAHALALYEENVRVPLFFAAPGLDWRAHRIDLASVIDIAPTTLSLVGLPPPTAARPDLRGQSLLAPSPRAITFVTEQSTRLAGVVDGPWKLILDRDARRAQLYHLPTDPHERHDRARNPSDQERAVLEHHIPCLSPS